MLVGLGVTEEGLAAGGDEREGIWRDNVGFPFTITRVSRPRRGRLKSHMKGVRGKGKPKALKRPGNSGWSCGSGWILGGFS